MVLNRFVIETGKETVSAIGTVAAAAAGERRTTAPEKGTTKTMDTTIREASEDTDTNHLLLLTEASWFVGGYRILKFLATSPPPFHAEGKKSIAAAVANSHGALPATAFATTPLLESRVPLTLCSKYHDI
jgi:hypothetical protein